MRGRGHLYDPMYVPDFYIHTYIYIYDKHVDMGLPTTGLTVRDFGSSAALGFKGHAAVGDLKVVGGRQEWRPMLAC